MYFFDAQKVFFFCAKDNLRIRIRKEETAHERSLQNDKRLTGKAVRHEGADRRTGSKES